MNPPPRLPAIVIDPIVRLALAEDFGRGGDITTMATIPPEARMRTAIRARRDGIVAGIDAALHTLSLIDTSVKATVLKHDGARFRSGERLMTFEGSAASILMAERVMLNFLGRLCGIATLTNAYVAKVAHTQARVVCTRKTTPGLRALEKHAVVCGGGTSHRYGLDDAMMIKDNHIAAAGGIGPAMQRARAALGHLRMIEIEVDTLDQLAEALPHAPHAVLLDNMTPPILSQAVKMIAGQCIAEASGGVTLDTIADIAASGVDVISVGALTHSATNLDLGMDVIDA